MPPTIKGEEDGRWLAVVNALAGTQWQSSLSKIDPHRTIALSLSDSGEVHAVTSTMRRERDYDLAVQVGLYAKLWSTRQNAENA